MSATADIESALKAIFKKVLDIQESAIVPEASLAAALGIDSTEMVEIAVVIKKEFGISLKDNELKKTQSLREIAGIIQSKIDGHCASGSCGCRH